MASESLETGLKLLLSVSPAQPLRGTGRWGLKTNCGVGTRRCERDAGTRSQEHAQVQPAFVETAVIV
ncbi:MAG: hypothetical protein KME26_08745 [Oscillatoria princeps RMCB-10]|nr:hypothetical protein [Oscillatoria princeps RMCB-10]